MILVGVMFQMNLLYFVILAALISYLSVRIIKNRKILFGSSSTDLEAMLKLGAMFAADFVIVALVFTINMMLSGYLTYQ